MNGLPSGVSRIETLPRTIQSGARTTWAVVVVFALAMAWVESAVVLYLRTMIDRIVPYQPFPLPDSHGQLGPAELVREAATLTMLATVGWLAGQTWRSRIAFGLLAFGVWDLAYYLWLIPLTGWPTSPFDWDILFLLPLPWWGPVWAPASIALLMCLFGTAVGLGDVRERPLWPRRASVLTSLAGMGLALYVFMADALRLVLSTTGDREQSLRMLLPTWFNWPVFLLALAMMALPVGEVVHRFWASCRDGT